MNRWWISHFSSLGIQRFDSIIFINHHQKSGSHLTSRDIKGEFMKRTWRNGDFILDFWGHGMKTPSCPERSGVFFDQQCHMICTNPGGLTNEKRMQCEIHNIYMYISNNIFYSGQGYYVCMYVYIYIYISLCTVLLILIEFVCVDSVDTVDMWMYLTYIAVFKQWWILWVQVDSFKHLPGTLKAGGFAGFSIFVLWHLHGTWGSLTIQGKAMLERWSFHVVSISLCEYPDGIWI